MRIDQAMDNESNLTTEEEIVKVQDAIVGLEKRVAFGKDFQKLYSNKLFKKIILNTLLGTELQAKAESLALNPYMDEELEEYTLTVLRSMRFLNKFITDKLFDAENAPQELKMNEDYLLQLMALQEDE